MIKIYRQLLDLLEPREQRIFMGLIGLMIVAAFAELLSLSIFLGLLGVLASPEIIETNANLAWAYSTFGFSSVFAFQVAASLAVVVVMMLGLCVKAGAAYAISRFTVMTGYYISTRLFSAYLRQRYSWSLSRNTAELAKNVLAESEQVARRAATPSLTVLSNLILAISIVGFLIYVDPVVALAAFGVIGSGYGLIYFAVHKRLGRKGAGLVEANRARFRMTQEATNGLKEVKLAGLEHSYSERFIAPSKTRAKHFVSVQVMTQMPRFALEGLTFLILLGIVLILLMRNEGDIAGAVPILGIFVFAIMRMLPALQQVYYGVAMMRSGEAVVEMIHADYTAVVKSAEAPFIPDRSAQLTLSETLEFNNVTYSYPAANKTALDGLSLKMKANTTIGVVGGTGAGKTTLVDLILGLLRPAAGEITVNGLTLDASNLRKWQNSIGYVPQQIYLTDDTVTANIAFGIPPEDIDHAAVKRAAKVAALHDFVTTELPDSYDTMVGERGVRLSGGQRQRIGIARALYHDPSMLILDEATSALDTITESVVMEAVQNLQHQKTIILIAHRLSTVRNCDVIFLMERGKLGAAGTYDELAANNATFHAMINASERTDDKRGAQP